MCGKNCIQRISFQVTFQMLHSFSVSHVRAFSNGRHNLKRTIIRGDVNQAFPSVCSWDNPNILWKLMILIFPLPQHSRCFLHMLSSRRAWGRQLCKKGSRRASLEHWTESERKEQRRWTECVWAEKQAGNGAEVHKGDLTCAAADAAADEKIKSGEGRREEVGKEENKPE